MPHPAIIHRLADFANGLTLADIPERVRRQGALTMLDTVGCMIAGSVTAEAKLLQEAEDMPGPASVLGSGLRLTTRAAARVNGYMGDIFEINDLTGGHAGIGNVAAALAAAETEGASGEDLLVATIAGVEVTTRIYDMFYPKLKPYSECGMVPVGLPSAVGAAAAAGRLFGLDRLQLREALAIAAALAGWCPAETIFGKGSTIKPMLFGASPAHTGLLAASYARAGLSGPAEILESPIGYFATVARGFSPGEFGTDQWALARPRRKLHACCGYIHSAIDAVVSLRQRDPQALSDARAIEVAMPAYVMPAVVKDGPPRTSNEARFHTRFCLAVAASGATAILPDHSERFAAHLADPAVAHAYARIHIVADPTLDHYHRTIVRVEDVAGKRLESRNDAPRGSPDNPLSDEEVIAKFEGLAGPVFGAARSARTCDLLLAVEAEQSLIPLFEQLRGANDHQPRARVATALGV